MKRVFSFPLGETETPHSPQFWVGVSILRVSPTRHHHQPQKQSHLYEKKKSADGLRGWLWGRPSLKCYQTKRTHLQDVFISPCRDYTPQNQAFTTTRKECEL